MIPSLGCFIWQCRKYKQTPGSLVGEQHFKHVEIGKSDEDSEDEEDPRERRTKKNNYF